MSKFDGVLICTDLDGTIYKNDKTISAENKQAIEYFKSEGGLFTFITGRMPHYSQNAYSLIEPNVPYGCANGGGLYDGEKGEYIWTLELPKTALELVEFIDEKFASVGIIVSTFKNSYFSKESDASVNYRRVTNLPNLVCNYRDIKEPISKILFATESGEDIAKIQEALKEHKRYNEFDYILSERILFEILPKGASKGLVLKKLVEHLNVKNLKTVAIGDYDNDVSMLRTADVGVAVANASKNALLSADVITVSNEEHAIARIIQDIENGKLF